MESKARFSSRVENYIRYRPGYPPQVIALLQEKCGLTAQSRVVDVGSGTGSLARLSLALGCPLTGVEPNPEMRAAGERLLAAYPNFTSRAGSAEDTGLPTACADIITAGQAFHWFDMEATRAEFARILRPGGWLVIVWNERRVNTSPFLAEYERLLHAYSLDYKAVDHRRFDPAAVQAFVGNSPVHHAAFENLQLFDLAGLVGRALSSSYVPEAGQPNHEAMLAGLHDIFDHYQQGGQVVFAYDTRVYYAQW